MGPVVDAALTAVMVVTPTAMYLGLWRLLMKMRDDDLVNRLDQRMKGAEESGRLGTPAAVGTPALDPADLDPELDGPIARRMRRGNRTRQCPDCRTLNAPRDESCLACGTDLPDADGDGLLGRLRR
ncbi:MAG: zinc finger Ran-binding domain-containing protein [Haloarculaceae archaeon]|jgi:hypothetical protein